MDKLLEVHNYLRPVEIKVEDGDAPIVLFSDSWDLFSTSLEKLVVRGTTFVINHNRQRKYLFKDKPANTGHVWQRNIFVSLIMGVPFPQFEIHIDGNKIWIEDGQQRYRTFQAIVNDMVKLPKDLSALGDEYVPYQNMCFSELPADIQNKIYNTQILLLNGRDLTQEELHKRFLLINNGTPLSAQDKRSAQISTGAEFIQGTVDGFVDEGTKLSELAPTRKMFNLNDGEYTKVNVPVRGRAFEEVVAHWYNTLHLGDNFQVSQGKLDKLYKEFKESNEVKHQKRFEKILDNVDKAILQYTKPKEIKGRKLLLFWFIVKHYLDEGYKIEHSTMFDNYIKVLSKLSTEDRTITYKKLNGEEEVLNFKRLLRICSDMAQIPVVINLILEGMAKLSDPIQVDKRRVFTTEEKTAKLLEQGGECGYCGVDLKLSECVGDHMVPHSLGGETTMDNLVVSCKSCNEMKSNLPYNLWEKLIPELKDSRKKETELEEA